MNREGRTFWTGCFGQHMTRRRSKPRAEPELRNAALSLSADCPHRPNTDRADAHSLNKLAATVGEGSPRTAFQAGHGLGPHALEFAAHGFPVSPCVLDGREQVRRGFR